MKKQKRVPTGDYEVGFCSAPKKYRFLKGQPSPNPAGRRGKKPKEEFTPADVVWNIMQERVKSSDPSLRMSNFEAFIRRLNLEALKGNVSAMRLLIQWIDRLGFSSKMSEVVGGVLVVPGAITPEDWAKAAFDQQAPFRGNIGEASDNKEDEDPKP